VGGSAWGKHKINLRQAFAGQKVGVKQVEKGIWRVSFMQYDLGFFDRETCRIESAVNAFAAKVSPMSPV
jgi:putative transposase